jgi:16S rRNA (adenine1518-N6/adenine1519-N6)-dimethyltransferase
VTKSIPALLRDHNLHPRKRLGQNFLTDPVALERILAAADLSPDDVVIEVGAGLGTLTRPLAERAGLILAIELDDRLVEILRKQLADLPNVQIVHGDVLKISGLGLSNLGYKVVANLPYYITSTVLRRFLSQEPRPQLMAVTVQREVAERIVAKPGAMSLLAVSVQFYSQPQIVARIPAGAFYPQPKVGSAVLRIEVSEQPTVLLSEGIDESVFFRVARAGFKQRRKMLRNSLSAGLALSPPRVEEVLAQAGVDPRRRAETLSLQEWADVAGALTSGTGLGHK